MTSIYNSYSKEKLLEICCVNNIKVTKRIRKEEIIRRLERVRIIEQFEISNYLSSMKEIIQTYFERPRKKDISYNILDSNSKETIEEKKISLKRRQKESIFGDIWQILLGNYNGFKNLGKKHPTGLDIISEEYKIIIELKSSIHTDNSSSKKTNFDKLARYKKEHPEFRCIYACVNDDTEEKTIQGTIKKIIHDKVEIEIYIGYSLFNLILGNDRDRIIKFVYDLINK